MEAPMKKRNKSNTFSAYHPIAPASEDSGFTFKAVALACVKKFFFSMYFLACSICTVPEQMFNLHRCFMGAYLDLCFYLFIYLIIYCQPLEN